MAKTFDDIPVLSTIPKTFDSIQVDTPKTFESIAATDTIGEDAQGFWKSVIENPEEKIPFIGSATKGINMYHIISACNRLKDPDYDYTAPPYDPDIAYTKAFRKQSNLPFKQPTKNDDIQLIESYLATANKKYSATGKVGRIVGDMPAFMVEFLATGGLKTLGEKGVSKIATKLLKGQAKRLTTKLAVGTAKYTTGAALRSAGLPQRAATSILKRQLPAGISYGKGGELIIQDSGESPLTSIIKGLGDHYIEVLSEQAGDIAAPALGKILKRTPFLGKVLPKVQAKWLKLHKNKTALDFVNKLGTKAGFNGIITEVGEEFYGDQLRAIFDINDFGAGEDAGFLERMNKALESDIENLPYMVAAFAIPGAGKAALGFAVSEDSKPINQQGTNIISEAKHKWAPEEVNETFGANIYEALEKVQAGEMDIDELVEMSELNEIEERKERGLPTINQQTIDADEFEKRVADQATEYMKDGMSESNAWDWARKTAINELEEELGSNKAQNEVKEEGEIDVTPAKGKIEFFRRKQFDIPKTTVVKELAKLMSVGLDLDTAISTLQDIRTPQIEEVSYGDALTEQIDSIIEGMKQANPDAFSNEVVGSRKSRTGEFIDSAKDAIRHYHWGMMRIGRMIEWLDGTQNGPIKNFIWKPMRAAVAKFALGCSYRMSQLNDFLSKLDINIKELYNNRIEIREGLTLSPVDMLEVFLATKDKEKLRNLKEGNKFTDEDIQDTLAALIQDEKLLIFGNWLLEQYGADFDEIADKYNQTTGRVLDKIPGYSAIRRLPEGKFARFIKVEEEFDDLIPQLLGGEAFKRKGLSKSMTFKRTRATGPLNLDALSNYIAHTRAVEHYKAMAIPVYNINRIINNNDFRKILHSKTSGVGNNILSKWLQDVVSERTSLENNYLSKIVGTFRRNAVVAALGLNVVTALKQPLSLSLAAAENPKMIPFMIKAFVDSTVNYRQLKEFVHKLSIVVRHRNMEREIREMSRRRSIRKKISGKRTLSEKSLFLVRLLDQMTVTIVWKAAYDMALGQGSEEQAIDYADSVIERTQPMADIMDLPHFFRGSEFDKLITVFQNQINQNYNYWAHDILGATKRGEISKAMLPYRVLMANIVPSIFLGLISRGFTPDDWKTWPKDMAAFTVAPLFFFGKIISAIINGYDPSSMVGFGWEQELFDAIRTKDPKDKIVHLVGAGAQAGGIPWSQPKRTIQGIMELNNMDSNDPRRLIWSKYVLDTEKNTSTNRSRSRGRKRSR